MRISPIDIQQQQFKTRPFGYEKAGVDQFLESLAEELERLLRQNQDLQEELARTNASLAEMREREGTLKETLMTTQKVTEGLKTTTRREVEVMMAEAEIKAERILHNAEDRRIQLIEEIQEIKRQKIDFETGLRGLLERHIRMLDLNSVQIESSGADAQLLEEPLPFGGKSVQMEREEPAPEKKSAGSDKNDSDRAAAVPAEFEKDVPDLTFDFDPEAESSDKDGFK